MMPENILLRICCDAKPTTREEPPTRVTRGWMLMPARERLAKMPPAIRICSTAEGQQLWYLVH